MSSPPSTDPVINEVLKLLSIEVELLAALTQDWNCSIRSVLLTVTKAPRGKTLLEYTDHLSRLGLRPAANNAELEDRVR